jgi:hypothetical protein
MHRLEDNINMDIQEVGWGMDLMEQTQDRDRWRTSVNAVISICAKTLKVAGSNPVGII